MSPTRRVSSPTSTRSRSHTDPLPGFIKPLKPRPRQIDQLSVSELSDLFWRNARILEGPSPSTSTYVPRIAAEQRAIQARLASLAEQESIESIRVGIKNTSISTDEDMNIDVDPAPLPRPIAAKRRALKSYGHKSPTSTVSTGLSFQEAVQIEQEAHAQDLARKQQMNEKKRRLMELTREERMWAFMNHKPTDSDLEDDDEDDDDEDDPSAWFEDEEDDGIKGQPIIEPDADDLQSIIRIDESRALGYGTFYEPRED